MGHFRIKTVSLTDFVPGTPFAKEVASRDEFTPQRKGFYEYAIGQGQGYQPKKGGYDSRLQQILYENPELEIVITDAGKSPDGSYIVYRIQTGVELALKSMRLWKLILD